AQSSASAARGRVADGSTTRKVTISSTPPPLLRAEKSTSEDGLLTAWWTNAVAVVVDAEGKERLRVTPPEGATFVGVTWEEHTLLIDLEMRGQRQKVAYPVDVTENGRDGAP
ncbi:MAG: hypothetical protein IMW86_06750, partial [Hydrogenibacillus sp.]|nr:hypothetical protein [Hydrogenibacillus sp.]